MDLTMQTVCHLSVLALVAFLVIFKVKLGAFTYFVLVTLLVTQLVYVSMRLDLEPFDDDATALTLHKLDTESMGNLTKLPTQIKNDVVPGIQQLIDNSKSNEEIAMIYPKDYPDDNVRIAYKHIDYLLEKIKLFSIDIYNALMNNE